MERGFERMEAILLRLWVLTRAEEGQSMVEYAVVTALVCAAAIAALTGFGDGVKSAFDAVVKKIPTS